MNTIMKLSTSVALFILPSMLSTSCSTDDVASLEKNILDAPPQISALMQDTLTINVGNKKFTAILESNAVANEFKKILPLTLNMKDLNSNEKFYDLPFNLPTNSSIPGTINAGDLMLWGSNTLVLFYRTFTTLYPYTRLGKIENTNGLSQALGTGNVTITFELLSK